LNFSILLRLFDPMTSSGWSVLRLPDFRAFVVARIATVLALQMQTVAMGWFVYDLTKSAWALGLIGLAAFLPAPVLALITGQVADRFDRRKVIAAGYGVACLVSLGMVVLITFKINDMIPIFFLTMLQGAARAFYMPATQALLPGLLPRENLSGGLALSATTMQTGTVLGPALGGFVYVFGPDVVFSIGACAFALGALSMLSITARPSVVAREPITTAHLLGGIHYIKAHPVVLGAISLDLFAVLLGGATALLPMFAQDILNTGPEGLGILRAAPAVGAISMALILTQWPIRRHAGRLLFAGVGVFGLAMIGFGLSEHFLLSLLCLYVSGLADMISVNVRQSLVQGNTPDEMRGRVSAVTTVFIGASNELGEFESGLAAALLGPVLAVTLGGACTVLIALYWTRLFPALWQRDRLLNPQ
jgi:MFS family permease